MDVTVRPPMIARVRPGLWLALDRTAAVVLAAVTFVALKPDAHGPASYVVVPLAVAALSGPVAVRRRWPAAALAVLCAGLVLVGLTELHPLAGGLGVLPMALVTYTVAATQGPRLAAVALAAALASAAGSALPHFAQLGGAVVFGLLLSVVWTVGFAVGLHRRYSEHLLRNQAALADAELERARRSLTEQRLQIARELHDLIAHGMSVITVQAAFGRLVIDERPDQARDALDVIETTGRTTLAELRQVVGVLRAPADSDPGPVQSAQSAQSGPLVPAPGLADVDRLVRQTDAAGVRVTLQILGTPRELPPAVDLAAYRIIQEALTNVVKHASTDAATVRVDHRPSELQLRVANAGPRPPGTPRLAGAGATPEANPETNPDTNPGHGIDGMRERASLCGGWVHAGPDTGGGFTVEACLRLLSSVEAVAAQDISPTAS